MRRSLRRKLLPTGAGWWSGCLPAAEAILELAFSGEDRQLLERGAAACVWRTCGAAVALACWGRRVGRAARFQVCLAVLQGAARVQRLGGGSE